MQAAAVPCSTTGDAPGPVAAGAAGSAARLQGVPPVPTARPALSPPRRAGPCQTRHPPVAACCSPVALPGNGERQTRPGPAAGPGQVLFKDEAQSVSVRTSTGVCWWHSATSQRQMRRFSRAV